MEENNQHRKRDQDNLDEDNVKEKSRSHSDMIEEEVPSFVLFLSFFFPYIDTYFLKPRKYGSSLRPG